VELAQGLDHGENVFENNVWICMLKKLSFEKRKKKKG
jgi:hypothetical protein